MYGWPDRAAFDEFRADQRLTAVCLAVGHMVCPLHRPGHPPPGIGVDEGNLRMEPFEGRVVVERDQRYVARHNQAFRQQMLLRCEKQSWFVQRQCGGRRVLEVRVLAPVQAPRVVLPFR